MMLTVVVTAVPTERDSVADGIGAPQAVSLGPYRDARRCETAGPDVVIVAGGVGPAAAAAAAAYLVATQRVGLLVSLGVAGAYPAAGLVPGDVVVATELVAADLGAGSPERFLDLASLGFGSTSIAVDPALVAAAADRVRATGRRVVTGPVLTLSTATGTAARAAELAGRHGAVAEAMEGFGVAHVAALHGVPVVEVRTISNPVGDRDAAAWDLLAALDSLTAVAGALLREPLC